ncbi:hypothetical protein [Virgisporangium aurantiacum]|uniref:DUF4878 domain-containing protein n=1 Tax=Virgisporangium aurantiacum TaxID=175570 RepID=A0A8J3Z9F9_9ACTN|nr:hypothetical protein [Virgisporangium aurantiacum]GIJ59582.1 hypothetical protein Vau01_070980 [Virgisporangium aurantiacum]
MLRRLAVLALAGPLALISACGGIDLPSVSAPSDPENDKLVGSLTTLVDTLGRGEYAAAAALLCPDAEQQDEAALRTEFEPHPRPWKQFVTYTSRSGDSGDANMDLTPSGTSVVRYTFSLKKTADGSWQVCDVHRGSVQVDVG